MSNFTTVLTSFSDSSVINVKFPALICIKQYIKKFDSCGVSYFLLHKFDYNLVLNPLLR